MAINLQYYKDLATDLDDSGMGGTAQDLTTLIDAIEAYDALMADLVNNLTPPEQAS